MTLLANGSINLPVFQDHRLLGTRHQVQPLQISQWGRNMYTLILLAYAFNSNNNAVSASPAMMIGKFDKFEQCQEARDKSDARMDPGQRISWICVATGSR
jgi:hypothetical protein